MPTNITRSLRQKLIRHFFLILIQIFSDGKLSGYIDGSDENVSSWMRFIRCARHKGEQNLYAFQYLGKVFYRAFKTILPGQEMLVWYDEKYPQYLGIPAAIFDLGAVIPSGRCSVPYWRYYSRNHFGCSLTVLFHGIYRKCSN